MTREELKENYPSLQYISCGKGWYSLIDQTFKKILEVNSEVEFYSVKEKFSGLRIWLNYPSNVSKENYQKICSLEREAEEASMLICEECSSPGLTISRNNWLKTLCVNCRNPEDVIYDWAEF